MWKKEKANHFLRGKSYFYFLMWKKEEIDESGYVTEWSCFCFSRFHASPLHSEGGSRAWCLKTIDARQMNQSKLSGEQWCMPHEKQNAFTRMLGCKTYLHPIERSTLKTLFVEIFSCFLILFFLLQELDFIIYLVCWCLKHAIIDKRCVFLYFKSGDRPMALSGGNINRCLVYFMFLCFVFVSYFVFFNFVALWWRIPCLPRAAKCLPSDIWYLHSHSLPFPTLEHWTLNIKH